MRGALSKHQRNIISPALPQRKRRIDVICFPPGAAVGAGADAAGHGPTGRGGAAPRSASVAARKDHRGLLYQRRAVVGRDLSAGRLAWAMSGVSWAPGRIHAGPDRAAGLAQRLEQRPEGTGAAGARQVDPRERPPCKNSGGDDARAVADREAGQPDGRPRAAGAASLRMTRSSGAPVWRARSTGDHAGGGDHREPRGDRSLPAAAPRHPRHSAAAAPRARARPPSETSVSASATRRSTAAMPLRPRAHGPVRRPNLQTARRPPRWARAAPRARPLVASR